MPTHPFAPSLSVSTKAPQQQHRPGSILNGLSGFGLQTGIVINEGTSPAQGTTLSRSHASTRAMYGRADSYKKRRQGSRDHSQSADLSSNDENDSLRDLDSLESRSLV
eukprot:TRINITY_DN7279_c0_g1_i2.p2 TRINITY_DN7279_c0_g1~~TRINITY_DN7279_c0_g1_i2.p2  ORF type:complete len:108 (-),score=19.67 TRINITY_DN7279_c0_g1_i2:508-831(-)